MIANNAMANHKRTFHIVLNKFDYFGDPTGRTFVAKPSLNSVIEKVNLAEEGLNSLELLVIKRTLVIYIDGISIN